MCKKIISILDLVFDNSVITSYKADKKTLKYINKCIKEAERLRRRKGKKPCVIELQYE